MSRKGALRKTHLCDWRDDDNDDDDDDDDE